MTGEARERLCIQLEGCTASELAELGIEVEHRDGLEIVWAWDDTGKSLLLTSKLDTPARGGQIPT